MPDGDNLIRITYDDANSEHVESLLRRQMSLRGERGITNVRKRRWYYQNWFLLMLVGGIFAFAAWAIIEPFLDDMVWLQGPITSIGTVRSVDGEVESAGEARKVTVPADGWIELTDKRVYISPYSRLWTGKKAEPLKFADLKKGQEVRTYLEHEILVNGNNPIVFADFVETSPSPVSPSRASMDLRQLFAQHQAASLLLFPLVAGLIGMAVGAADGIVCRLPRRALLSGVVGLLVGFIGGFISHFLAELAYAPLSHLAMKQMAPGATHLSPFAFFVQMTGRGLGWMLAGMAMGLGQGIALRSKRLFIYGFIGGIVGGLLGGLMFDPIDMLILGMEKPSAHIARMIGITVIGLCVGAMIGVVELLARDAWLRMTEGPLAGKEFLLFKDTMRIGSSSRSDIYLFNDPQVSPNHAVIRSIGDTSEIDSSSPDSMVLVNQRPTRHARLRHGDAITIGRTSFLYQSRKG